MKILKPIETVYKGYRFRSRLEARYGVFFDSLKIPWEYEKEGFELYDSWYLPDFYLPSLNCWCEIKGDDNQLSDALVKLTQLTALSRKSSCLIHNFDDELAIVRPIGSDYPFPLNIFNMFNPTTIIHYDNNIDIESVEGNFGSAMNNFAENEEAYAITIKHYSTTTIIDKRGFVLQKGHWASSDNGKIFLMGTPIDWFMPKDAGDGQIGLDSPTINSAYLKAKQARFEHGEIG